ncbi:hypothetical protein JOF53_001116 [Crossiella equi]|uniref:O-methyltransferase C-terminal domain-containing protein n=1 Tax=Crossiella equi TaxID=130796 RepID=A0ABS5A6M6_9PSEU|nr:methyltransferase [Crossiella equi]MBP2472244.1 hypothetical protein [Crossiella equi]
MAREVVVGNTGRMASESSDVLAPLPLMQLGAGFWGFKTFATALGLGLLTRLADGSTMDVAEAPETLRLFWDANYCLSTFTARSLGETYDFSSHSRMLDVGGGARAFPIELARQYPGLSATIYDLPHVCPLAEAKIEESGMSGRISTVAGDFLRETELPGGHDVVLFSMNMHNWGENTCRELLKRACGALPAGGVVLIAELVPNPERTGPAEAALMGMDPLTETQVGRNYSEAEYTTWLREAGFAEVRTLPLRAAGVYGVVLGVKR